MQRRRREAVNRFRPPLLRRRKCRRLVSRKSAMATIKQRPADIRLALLNAGFAPVACIGKDAILKDWPNRQDATPEQVVKWGGGNTGVATKFTPACDADIDIPEPAARIEEVARDRFDGRG